MLVSPECLFLRVYYHSLVCDVDEVYVVGAYASELERSYMYHNLMLGNSNSTSKYSFGEESNMAYYTGTGRLRATLFNALLATAFFRCW